jgi:hypothetical protein
VRTRQELVRRSRPPFTSAGCRSGVPAACARGRAPLGSRAQWESTGPHRNGSAIRFLAAGSSAQGRGRVGCPHLQGPDCTGLAGNWPQHAEQVDWESTNHSVRHHERCSLCKGPRSCVTRLRFWQRTFAMRCWQHTFAMQGPPSDHCGRRPARPRRERAREAPRLSSPQVPETRPPLPRGALPRVGPP